MNESFVLALIDALVDEKINNLDTSQFKGPRGQKGRPGKSFVFENHEDEIKTQLLSYVDSIRDQLTLTFDKLSEDEKESIRLTFDKLSEEERESIRGPRGPRGKPGNDGRTPELGDYADFLRDEIREVFISSRDNLRLKLEDLSEDEIQDLRGPRGPRGQKGKPGSDGIDGQDGASFSFDENKERINGLISEFIVSIKEDIRGEKGPRGQRGKRGLPADRDWETPS